MLSETSENISEISSQIGYECPGKFAETFRKYTRFSQNYHTQYKITDKKEVTSWNIMYRKAQKKY